MPCQFDMTVRSDARHWRSADNMLRPNASYTFHVGTNNVGGGCGHCRAMQNGVIWASAHYVLCLSCATRHFGAPDLRAAAPELFVNDPNSPDVDEAYEESPMSIETKKDKDFDPAQYRRYVHSEPLMGSNGCAGYRCPTFEAPYRTIPAGVPFMLGNGTRGHLCMACFDKLKGKFDALPLRVQCPMCERRVLAHRMGEVLYRDYKVCFSCREEYYMNCPDTDGGWIERDRAVFALRNRTERVYASRRWAEQHWFEGREHWFQTEAELDAEMFSLDEAYRDQRIAANTGATVFQYGTNIIKMHGFPDVTRRDSLCFGVELEMQPNANHTHTQVVSALGGKFVAGRPYILCADSSLGSQGVELITLPYTLANHKADKLMPWTKVLHDLRQCAKSGQNTTSCGMHVHINRRALSHLQMGKMLIVINAPEMQELITTIAQRSESSYAGRYFKKIADGGKVVGSHGDALNMSNRKGTVELRIFRGNLRYERVMKNLEFAEALCMYAQDQSIQRIHVPAEMLAWIEDHKAHYPHLVKFLREEYRPTKAFERSAKRIRVSGNWESAPGLVNIEPTEGDI